MAERGGAAAFGRRVPTGHKHTTTQQHNTTQKPTNQPQHNHNLQPHLRRRDAGQDRAVPQGDGHEQPAGAHRRDRQARARPHGRPREVRRALVCVCFGWFRRGEVAEEMRGRSGCVAPSSLPPLRRRATQKHKHPRPSNTTPPSQRAARAARPRAERVVPRPLPRRARRPEQGAVMSDWLVGVGRPPHPQTHTTHTHTRARAPIEQRPTTTNPTTTQIRHTLRSRTHRTPPPQQR